MPDGFGTFNLGNVLGQAENIRGAQVQRQTAQLANQRQNALLEREAQFNPLARQFLAGETGIEPLAAIDPAAAGQLQGVVSERNALAQAQQQQEADEMARAVLLVGRSQNKARTIRTLFPEVAADFEARGIILEDLDAEDFTDIERGILEQVAPMSSLSLEELFGTAPAGFRRTPQGELEFIPGGPKDPDTIAREAQAKQVAAATTDKTFEKTNKLVTEARRDKRISDHMQVANALIRVEAAGDTAAGDVSLIFAFMRALDPASTVREGEFATAQNSTGVEGRVRALYNQALTGQRLTEELREDFKTQARNLAQGTESSARAALEGMRPRAEQANIDFSLIEQSIFPGVSGMTDEEILEGLR